MITPRGSLEGRFCLIALAQEMSQLSRGLGRDDKPAAPVTLMPVSSIQENER